MKQSFTYLVLFSLLLSTPIFSQSIVNNVEAGTALYYADYLEGRRTASGEVFQQSELTCAHKTYPFGTWLRITRLDNQQSVTVRVNDRGPFCEGCVVDLSKAAAARINLLQAGRAEVKVEAMGVTQAAPAEELTARGGNNIPQSFNNTSSRIPNSYSNVPQSYSNVPQSYSTVPQNNTIRRRTTTQNTNTGASTLSSWEQDLRNRTSSQVRPRTYSYTSPTLSSRAPANTTAVRDQEFTSKGSATPRTNVPTNYSWSPNTAIRGTAARTNTAPSTTTPAAVPANYSYVPSANTGYGVQVASYANYNNADKRQRSVYAKGINNVFIKQGRSRNGNQVFRVVVGPFSDQNTAAQSLRQLQSTYSLKGFVLNLAK